MIERKKLILSIMIGIITVILGWTMTSVWHGIAAMIAAVCFIVIFEEAVGGIDGSYRGRKKNSEGISGHISA